MAAAPKPTILVFIDEPLTKKYFDSIHEYDILYYLISFDTLPTTIVTTIKKFLGQKKKTIQGVLGLGDRTSILASIIAKEFNLVGPSPHSILLAQHKTFFTTIAKKVNPYFPQTMIINTNTQEIPNLFFPGFMKPVKSSLSQYSYLVKSEEDLKDKVIFVEKQKREIIPWFENFARFVLKTYPPLTDFLLQPYIASPQYTVDGFVCKKTTTILGITESVFNKAHTSFERFDFPSILPKQVFQELKDTIELLIIELGFDNSGFNIEFFVHNNHIVIIEFNTRISMQFIPLMAYWYKTSTIKMMLDLATGKKPNIDEKPIKYQTSCCVLRTTTDQVVESHGTKKQIDEFKKKYHIEDVVFLGMQGKKLSIYQQDSYTFRYASLYIIGINKAEILKKLAHAVKNIPIRMTPVT